MHGRSHTQLPLGKSGKENAIYVLDSVNKFYGFDVRSSRENSRTYPNVTREVVRSEYLGVIIPIFSTFCEQNIRKLASKVVHNPTRPRFLTPASIWLCGTETVSWSIFFSSLRMSNFAGRIHSQIIQKQAILDSDLLHDLREHHKFLPSLGNYFFMSVVSDKPSFFECRHLKSSLPLITLLFLTFLLRPRV